VSAVAKLCTAPIVGQCIRPHRTFLRAKDATVQRLGGMSDRFERSVCFLGFTGCNLVISVFFFCEVRLLKAVLYVSSVDLVKEW
jgi:hypothetical protein